jgi:phosphoribosyl 1,2-cyclic phosphate phosphodiesterase
MLSYQKRASNYVTTFGASEVIVRFSVLGSGSVYGAPVMGCVCSACYRARNLKEYARAETSALLEEDGFRIVIDAGLANLEDYFIKGDSQHILLTHYHMDHVLGLFKLRWGIDCRISVIGPDDPEGCGDLFKHPGILDFQHKAKAFEQFELGPFKITPLPLQHSKLTYGYFIESLYDSSGSIAYLTDTVGLPKETADFLKRQDIDLAVIDASEPPTDSPPRNHNDLTMALDIHRQIRPQRSVLTHIGHELDVWFEQNPGYLPSDVLVARDGQTYEVVKQIQNTIFKDPDRGLPRSIGDSQ